MDLLELLHHPQFALKMAERPSHVIALIGLGSIGISFAALHLKHSNASLRVYDSRPDLDHYVASVLPAYLDRSLSVDSLIISGRLKLCSTLEEACTGASIVQEQGPENLRIKVSLWSRVLEVVSQDTHLWSSTSGIPASEMVQDLKDKSRLLVIHPFNPPHIMPLIEIVPSPATDPIEVTFARSYFETLQSGHRPVVVRKEIPGFVANRLAFVLFREACSLVAGGVVDVKDLDDIVEASLGPRWAVTGPFKSYNHGGGTGGLPAFLENLSETMGNVWESAGLITFDGVGYSPGPLTRSADGQGKASEVESPWMQKVIQQTVEAYGYPDASALCTRDDALRKVLKATEAKS